MAQRRAAMTARGASCRGASEQDGGNRRLPTDRSNAKSATGSGAAAGLHFAPPTRFSAPVAALVLALAAFASAPALRIERQGSAYASVITSIH